MSSIQYVDEALLRLLVCPVDHDSLLYVKESNVLYNPRLKRSYPVREGIPVMLEEESVAVDEETHKEYVKIGTSTSSSDTNNA